ncbi:MAG TPA: glycosyltransferase family 2 protein, partial [Candidatus Thermoplasmatota archaeon]|nr:glycosyltransferase family 2 protein [Candidatus Thermoplasmatota archaeon]
RVLVGHLGSKARELNLAWAHARTRYVLLLDADETIDRRSLCEAVAVLRGHPEVGVVQGRKVSRAPGDGFLARLVCAERRYCTWMDHVMHSESLGSGHFGGSAALLRREVAADVGGWTDQTLTEDIEFTLRLHLHGRWRIAYLPEMVVREADPATAADLLRQRTRWARGWAQCLPIYLPQVVRQRSRLGRKRAFGLALLLLISVSALWTTFVPASILMRFAGVSPLLPLAVVVPITLLLLPSRLLAYGYAALRDPVIPLERRPGRLAELALHAYLWILIGWFVQLHALYLELASAPRLWTVTAKKAAAPAPA